MEVSVARRSCFAVEDDGLASLAETDAGFSGKVCNSHNHSPVFRNIRVVSSSPISPRYEDRHRQQPHFLESCFLCKRSLGINRDIFMYRGDTAFCSEDCRQEQIDMDEAKDKAWNLSSSMKSMRKDQRRSNSPPRDQGYAIQSTVAAA
ncbi:hypothetical protein SAY87_030286 [Trapa incisa]|uniref:FLZ-type domain-containing protein n=1 Tax=Trapa incisa TaxID=236973 RepID=A0AAN7KRK4_9MYRT|nr:hypothetical protein SAY87_030286 [Trapa incisa]